MNEGFAEQFAVYLPFEPRWTFTQSQEGTGGDQEIRDEHADQVNL